MECTFLALTKGSPCITCGYTLKRDYDRPLRRACDAGVVYVISRLSNGNVLWGCRACSWTHENDGEEIEHVCGRRQITRLVDRVKSALGSEGITQDRVDAFLSKYGLPDCGCRGKKQQWLKDLDRELALGERLAGFQRAVGWTPREAKDGQSARTTK